MGTYRILNSKTKVKWMNSLNVHATGVIFPTNEKPQENGENDGYFQDRVLQHQVSKYNQQDLFYTFPIYVPKESTEDGYTKWREDFYKNVSAAMTVIGRKIQMEKKHAKNIRNHIGNWPSRI